MKNKKTIIFDLDGVLWQFDFVGFGRMIAKDLEIEESLKEEFALQIPNVVKTMLQKTTIKINKGVIIGSIEEFSG